MAIAKENLNVYVTRREFGTNLFRNLWSQSPLVVTDVTKQGTSLELAYLERIGDKL